MAQDADALEREQEIATAASKDADKLQANKHKRQLELIKTVLPSAYFGTAIITGVYLLNAGFIREGLFMLAGALSMTAAWRMVKLLIEKRAKGSTDVDD